ncbi:MAG: Fic family protein [Bacillota bacterium]
MKWITIETVLEIHDQVIKSTGGSYGLRDKNALESALNSPLATFEGKELYPGFLKKVAVLLYKTVNNHSFVDGNKRTLLLLH